MSYQFPPDLDEQIKQRMASGQYSSEDDALRALRWQDAEVEAIREGIEDLEAGRITPLREFDREFRKRKQIA